MFSLTEVVDITAGFTVLAGIDYYKLDFHFLRYYCLYVNAYAFAGMNVIAKLGKSCEIWTKLDEYAIIFNRANNS